MRPAACDECGQASVEVIALVPLLIAAALAAAAILAHAGAGERAGEAARAGAMALLQDEDPLLAAREALTRPERSAAHIVVRGRRVTVTLPPPSGLRRLVTLGAATATADAGPEPAS